MSAHTANQRLAVGRQVRSRGGHPGPARMLTGDAYIAIRLLREALRRVAGVRADASLLTTMFAIGVLANALRRVAAPVLRVFRPRPTTLADATIATAVAREVPRGLAGIRAGDKPFAVTMIAVSLVAPALRGIAAPALRLRAGLGRWYGA
jgi:hypothetical protein